MALHSGMLKLNQSALKAGISDSDPRQSLARGAAPDEPQGKPYRDGFLTIAPVLGLMALVLLLGLYIPQPLGDLVKDAVAYLEVTP